MLSLTMREGDYLTIGDDIFISFAKGMTKSQMCISIDAPRNVPIIRESLLAGHTQPDAMAKKQRIRTLKEGKPLKKQA